MNVYHLPDTMKAAILRAPYTVSIEQIPVPDLLPHEVLVKVEAVGLCGSDLHFYTGERALHGDTVLGHEITGRLIAVGEHVSPERLGERVTIEPNIPCETCHLCTRGLGRLCAQKQIVGQTRQGGLAEFVAVDHRFAWHVPESVTLQDAATIEPTAVAIHALSRAQVSEGATIAIVGCGGVGQLVATVAIAQGYRVVALEPQAHRRAQTLALGVLDVRGDSDTRAARLFFEQHQVTALFECAGVPTTTQLCLDAAPPGSTLVLVGLATENVVLNPLQFVRREIDIRGALIYDHPTDFAATIALIAAHKLAPGKTTSQPQPLENIAALFEAMRHGTQTGKPLIDPRLSTYADPD